MDCQIRRAELVAELVLVGSLDSSWTPYLADQIDELVRAGAHEVWFDMSRVTYLSSHGIAIIVRYHRQLLKIGGRVRIVAGSELVTSVLKLSGVTQVLDVEGQSPPREADPTAAYHLLEARRDDVADLPRAGRRRAANSVALWRPGAAARARLRKAR